MAFELDNQIPGFNDLMGAVVEEWGGEKRPSAYGGTDLMRRGEWAGRVFTDENGVVRVVVPDWSNRATDELEEQMMRAYSLRTERTVTG